MSHVADNHPDIRGVSLPHAPPPPDPVDSPAHAAALSHGDAAIAALADRQHGVIAHRQLVDLGYGARAIENRVATARLHPVHKGIYAVGRRSLAPKGHVMAAALACGPNAVISHRSAAALWELRPTDQIRIDVTVPGGSRQNRSKIRVHRTRKPLCLEDIAQRDNIPATSVARTILDLAPISRPEQLTRVLEQAERMRLFDLRALERIMARNPRRSGIKNLREVLADYRDPPPTRSELEREFSEIIARAGLPQPRVNVYVAGLEVDFFWPAQRLVVELDGRAYHSSPRAFERDRVRDAILQRAGCRVLRITYKRLHTNPQGVLEDIVALLALGAET